MENLDSVEIIRVLNLATCVTGLVVWCIWARRNPVYRWLAVAPATFLFHLGLFHLVRLLACPIAVPLLNAWSASIQLHGAILLIAIPLIWRRVGHE